MKKIEIEVKQLENSKLPKPLIGMVSELRSLYNSNKTCKEIAQAMNVGESTLTKAIKLLGLKRTPRYKKKGYDPQKIQELISLGISHINIAKKLGISLSTLKRACQCLEINFSTPRLPNIQKKAVETRKYCCLNGIRPTCPNRSNVLEKFADKIIDLLDAGVSKTEIARRYNVSIGTVFNFIYLYQLKAPIIKKTSDVERIITAFNQGKKHREIAEELNCSTKVLSQAIKELNLKRPYSAVKKTTSLSIYEDLVKELYLKGLSGNEIAKQVHAHPFSVYKKIRRMGLERPKKWAEYNSKFKGKKQLLFEMYSKGMSVSELASLFGSHENTVRYHLKKRKAM